MNRKTLTRIAFAAVAVPALAFGAPATAMADSFFSGESTVAGYKGAASHSVKAVAVDGHGKHHHGKDHGHGHSGGSYFKESSTWAGYKGAGSHSIFSGAR